MGGRLRGLLFCFLSSWSGSKMQRSKQLGSKNTNQVPIKTSVILIVVLSLFLFMTYRKKVDCNAFRNMYNLTADITVKTNLDCQPDRF